MSAYTDRIVALALHLINTHDPYRSDPEKLGTPANLVAFLVAHGIPPGEEVGERELAELREIRDRLRAAFEAADARAIAVVTNALLAGASMEPQVVAGDAGDWDVVLAVAPATPPVRRLAVEAALGLGVALREHGVERLRVCAAAPCREAFVDTSRNRSRRYCSDRCANRHNIAAFRERERVSGRT